MLRLFPAMTCAAALLLAHAAAGTPDVPAPRELREIGGIIFEYAPRHAPLIEALAARVAALNEEPAPPRPPPPPEDATVALTPEHFEAGRQNYLASLARLSGRTAPSELQHEIYERILKRVTAMDRQMRGLAAAIRTAAHARRVTVWDRAELLAHLQAGQPVSGFSLNARGDGADFNWSTPPPPTTDAPETPSRLGGTLNYMIKGERFVLSGELELLPEASPRLPASPAPPPPADATPFAVVLDAEESVTPPEVLAERIATEDLRSTRQGLYRIAYSLEQAPMDGGALAFVLLKETTRLDIEDQLGVEPDRRWIAEGAARYVAWRLIEDAHTPEAAVATFDLGQLLARTQASRSHVDLSRWPELGPDADGEARQRHEAHQAQAAWIFFLTAQRAGPDAVPAFLRDLRQLPPRRLNARAIADAFRRTTGLELKRVMADVRGSGASRR